MIDIDGVVCDHVDNEFPEKMKTVEEIAGAKDWINSKYDEGNYIEKLLTYQINKRRVPSPRRSTSNSSSLRRS